MIACNTIAEGDTRQVGLERLCNEGASIICAHPDLPWPGVAAVVISPVSIYKKVSDEQPWKGARYINDTSVEIISPYLSSEADFSPEILIESSSKAYQGSLVLGMGFVMSPNEAEEYLQRNPLNSEALFPYVNGDDLNTSYNQSASRFVVNFFDWPVDRSVAGEWNHLSEDSQVLLLKSGHVTQDYPSRTAADFEELFSLIEEKVKPERIEKSKSASYSKIMSVWWQHWNQRPGLYHAIGRGSSFVFHPLNWVSDKRPMPRVIASARVTKYFKLGG